MKIVCDVCGKEEASVFCCADEAALCHACDRRVHRANKLAGKHRRLSLLGPSSHLSHPLCDICQERRGYVFCQEDRAILCRDCDAPIHSANSLTMKHNRFLLTGVRLSAAPISTASSASFEAEEEMTDAAINPHDSNNRSSSSESAPRSEQNMALAAEEPAIYSTTAGGNGSSISDYLIKMCPGWRVEDLLVDDSAAAFAAAADGLSKRQDDELLPFLEADLDGGGGGLVPVAASSAEEFPMRVPRVPQLPPPELAGAGHYPPWIGPKEANQIYQQGLRERRSDGAFTVPQISPASTKRPRLPSLWYY